MLLSPGSSRTEFLRTTMVEKPRNLSFIISRVTLSFEFFIQLHRVITRRGIVFCEVDHFLLGLRERDTVPSRLVSQWDCGFGLANIASSSGVLSSIVVYFSIHLELISLRCTANGNSTPSTGR